MPNSSVLQLHGRAPLAFRNILNRGISIRLFPGAPWLSTMDLGPWKRPPVGIPMKSFTKVPPRWVEVLSGTVKVARFLAPVLIDQVVISLFNIINNEQPCKWSSRIHMYIFGLAFNFWTEQVSLPLPYRQRVSEIFRILAFCRNPLLLNVLWGQQVCSKCGIHRFGRIYFKII